MGLIILTIYKKLHAGAQRAIFYICTLGLGSGWNFFYFSLLLPFVLLFFPLIFTFLSHRLWFVPWFLLTTTIYISYFSLIQQKSKTAIQMIHFFFIKIKNSNNYNNFFECIECILLKCIQKIAVITSQKQNPSKPHKSSQNLSKSLKISQDLC